MEPSERETTEFDLVVSNLVLQLPIIIAAAKTLIADIQ
jgi:hypothetical protein